MTDLERFLFGGHGAHGIIEFTLVQGCVRLRLAPWEGLRLITEATFESAKVLSLSQFDEPDEEDLNLPWDIIGFDSYELPDECWKFVLVCGALEWCWESKWPKLKRETI
jgi:hypothetical protein